MKKNVLNRFWFAICIPIMIIGCEDNESPTHLTSDFASVGSSYFEKDGTGTIVIPFRNGTSDFVADVEVTFSGAATEGEDFTLVGVSSEGVQLNIIDDNEVEPIETIIVQIGTTGNNVHTVTIESNCEDTSNPYLKYFRGTFSATEKYGPAPADWYGPYNLTLTQDGTDPTKFNMTNFYDAGRQAYVVIDLTAGTVHFPDQTPSGSTKKLTNSSGTFTITPCGIDINIKLNYDGGDWDYSWTLVKTN